MYVCKQCKHTFKQSKKAQQIENKKKKSNKYDNYM